MAVALVARLVLLVVLLVVVRVVVGVVVAVAAVVVRVVRVGWFVVSCVVLVVSVDRRWFLKQCGTSIIIEASQSLGLDMLSSDFVMDGISFRRLRASKQHVHDTVHVIVHRLGGNMR